MRTIQGRAFLTPHEVANRIGIDRRTVIRWVKRPAQGNAALDELKVFIDPTNKYMYFDRQSVEQLVASHLVPISARELALEQDGNRGRKRRTNASAVDHGAFDLLDEMDDALSRLLKLRKPQDLSKELRELHDKVISVKAAVGSKGKRAETVA